MFKKVINDSEILNAIKKGNDDKALRVLYDKLLPKTIRLTKKYRVKEIDSYDIFQEALLKFYDYVKKGKFNENYTIEAFILRIVRNKLIDTTRKKTFDKEIDITEYNESFQTEKETMLDKEKESILKTIFEPIGEKCKELLLLSMFDKRSMTEISEILGFSSVNSAKTQNYKCKQKLIKSLEQNPSLAKEVLSYV